MMGGSCTAMNSLRKSLVIDHATLEKVSVKYGPHPHSMARNITASSLEGPVPPLPERLRMSVLPSPSSFAHAHYL